MLANRLRAARAQQAAAAAAAAQPEPPGPSGHGSGGARAPSTISSSSPPASPSAKMARTGDADDAQGDDSDIERNHGSGDESSKAGTSTFMIGKLFGNAPSVVPGSTSYPGARWWIRFVHDAVATVWDDRLARLVAPVRMCEPCCGSAAATLAAKALLLNTSIGAKCRVPVITPHLTCS